MAKKGKKSERGRLKAEIDATISAIAARPVTRDVRLVYGDLIKALADNDTQRTRIAWITSLTLLRSVGHVLVKVDARRAKWLKEAIAAKLICVM